MKLGVIVASGRVSRFNQWLCTSYRYLRGSQVKIILVTYGDEIEKMKKSAPEEIEILEAGLGETLESNRNLGIECFRSSPPELVAFLDDDTFINPRWTDAIFAAADTNPKIDAFATVVFNGSWNEMQSAGHVFHKGGPWHRGYKGRVLEKSALCPCFNSGVVRWPAIERIKSVHNEIWDPLFKQQQTCFDFGLKLWLTGSETMVVPGAVAQHEGHFSWSAELLRQEGWEKVRRELESRYLLYYKFLKGDLLRAELESLNRRFPKWTASGYPGFKEIVRGTNVDKVVAEARESAEANIDKLVKEPWQCLMDKNTDSWKIWDLERPEF
jgi:GT2 family glycosyltransferase